jgi:hypothetical protein
MKELDPIRKPSPKKIRAFKQAPWREQLRLLASGLAAIFGLMAMLGLFIFTGAQSAEAGLRVQSLIRERDHLLRQLESQETELAGKQSEVWMRQRAEELGFAPVDPKDIVYLAVPSVPETESVYVSPTSFLFGGEKITIAPAYRETLLEWIIRTFIPGGGR